MSRAVEKGHLLMGTLEGMAAPRVFAVTATSKLQSGDTKAWLSAWIDGRLTEGTFRFPRGEVCAPWRHIDVNAVHLMVRRVERAFDEYGGVPHPRDTAIRAIRAVFETP